MLPKCLQSDWTAHLCSVSPQSLRASPGLQGCPGGAGGRGAWACVTSWGPGSAELASCSGAGYDTEFIVGGDLAKSDGDGAEVDVLGVHQGLQVKMLQNGRQEQEKLHACQAFSHTDPLSWK